jgi:hypothetical protein
MMIESTALQAARSASMSSGAHRALFLCAACFNWLAGLPLLVATTPVSRIMGLDVNPTAVLFIQLTAGVIVVFGGAYAMVARDPVRYRAYIPLGLILKVYVVAVVYGWWLSGGIPWPLPALAAGDIVFAALFWRYYRASGMAAFAADQGTP